MGLLEERRWRVLGAGVAAWLLLAGTAQAAAEPPGSLVTVRTLVIDALGTRTVDTDVARIPFGGTGLLIKRVPYAGPALSFRLSVTAGQPQEAGIPLTIAAEVWNGPASPAPPSSQVSRREEATVVSPEGSYLFEIDHDERSDRRIVLSLSARPTDERDLPLPPPAAGPSGPIRMRVEVMREGGAGAEAPDTHELVTMLGLAVSYSSGVKVPGARPGRPARFVGLTVTLTPMRAVEGLLTVRAELSGADYVDEARTRLEPFQVVESRTVASGVPFDLDLRLSPGSEAAGAGIRPVAYSVRVTPTF